MALPSILQGSLSLPVIGSPMFIVSQPPLVLAQCLAGIVGSFPALNARPPELLDSWLAEITGTLAAARQAHPDRPIAPFAVNQIVHGSNDRLDHDVALCEKHRVPIVITSLRPPGDVVKRIHAYGGLVFHDVISIRHAQKALDEGVDGLILVSAGAGGHAGTLNPMAFVAEIRRFYQGTVILSGAIATGRGILAAQAMGADLAYVGTRFIATREATASQAYKDMLVESQAADIVYTPTFTGVNGNYLRPSIVAAGLDPDNLPVRDKTSMDFGTNRPAKAWRDIWGAGQGVGSIDDVPDVATLVGRLTAEYTDAKAALAG